MAISSNTIKGAHHPPKSVQSRMDTLILTPEMVSQWRLPECQRPKRINCKVQMASEKIRREEVISGVLTLGMVRGDPSLYIVDGQHRIEGFKMTGLDEVIADVRIVVFNSFAEMAEEFVELNSALVIMRPDDILRGSEPFVPALKQIRTELDFVGYDQVRRGGVSGPIVSMSALIRCWRASQYDVPANSNMSKAIDLAKQMDEKSIKNLISFMSVAFEAWKRDPEHFKLWGNLNLALCMWMWNRLVIDKERLGTKRYAVLDIPLFKKCLMSVAADADYSSWLVGRNLSDRDRSPCYERLKAIFAARLTHEGKPSRLPLPAWAKS